MNTKAIVAVILVTLGIVVLAYSVKDFLNPGNPYRFPRHAYGDHPQSLYPARRRFYYGSFHALKEITFNIAANRVTALIGPSGCGKSTFLRCLNRMNDLIDGTKIDGSIELDGVDIYDASVDPVQLRKEVGMVFQKPNPFPVSIYDNIAYGPRIHGINWGRSDLDDLVEKCLRRAALWEEARTSSRTAR